MSCNRRTGGAAGAWFGEVRIPGGGGCAAGKYIGPSCAARHLGEMRCGNVAFCGVLQNTNTWLAKDWIGDTIRARPSWARIFCGVGMVGVRLVIWVLRGGAIP